MATTGNGTAPGKDASMLMANQRSQSAKARMSFRDDRDLEGQIKDQELKKTTWMATIALTYRTIGVIYGDIGTSPLYVYASTFLYGPPSQDDVVGLCSLIIWTIFLVVVIKYITIVISADDKGEGGTFALFTLIARHCNIPTPNLQMVTTADMALSRYTSNSNIEDSKPASATKQRMPLGQRAAAALGRSKAARGALLCVALLATSMILGDGVLTPAISVISAVVGIQVAAPSITTGTIVGISCAILFLLFCGQRYGTSKVGFTFAPIIIVWYGSNVMINLYNIITYYPAIFKAISPHYLFLFFIRNGYTGWVAMGGTLLCITGTEAMYADLGHFSKASIRLGFLCVAFPSLCITYLGQAAYLMVNPENVSTTFYSCIPSPVYWPMFVVSVMAAIIASQAMISGAFSIVKQSIALGCFPRLDICHTSATVVGQIYIPVINWILMVLTIAVVAGFQNGTVIGNAYGVAVTVVMFITTQLMLVASLVVFHVSPLISLPVWALFCLIDGAYLSANLFKFTNGGWFPIALSILIFLISAVWFYGRQRKSAYLKEHAQALEGVLKVAPVAGAEVVVEDESEVTLGGSKRALVLAATGERVARVPGVGLVFSDTVTGVPPVFTKWLENISAVHECTVLVTIRNVPVTTVLPEERFLFKPILNAPGFYRAVARYGYRDHVDLGEEFAAELKKEIALCVKPFPNGAPAQTVNKLVYVMGETVSVPKPGSKFWRRFLLECLYNPLALVTRSRNATWNVPRALTISFTVVLEV